MNIKTFYNKEKYDFIYDENVIKIKHKKIGKYIAEFNTEDLKEIHQTTKNGQTHFLVLKNNSLEHYTIGGIKLKLVRLFNEVHSFESITDTCYKFWYAGGTVLYSLDKESYYDDIYTDTLENDVVLVERNIQHDELKELNDRLIYGVDINTHEIETPMWSRMQQRMINLYNKEEKKEWCKKHGGLWYTQSNDVILNSDIISTLNEIANRLPLSKPDYVPEEYAPVDDEIYNDEGYLNEEFVKRFEIKKKF